MPKDDKRFRKCRGRGGMGKRFYVILKALK